MDQAEGLIDWQQGLFLVEQQIDYLVGLPARLGLSSHVGDHLAVQLVAIRQIYGDFVVEVEGVRQGQFAELWNGHFHEEACQACDRDVEDPAGHSELVESLQVVCL